MTEPVATNPILQKLHDNRGMILPLAVVGLILVILMPLPAAALDVLLIANLTLSVIVLVTVIHVRAPLEFAVFPSLLLGITLFRLVLNVATTRLILTAGDRVADPLAPEALAAAGGVVMTFSNFVTAGSLSVGIVIFLIIFVIQFVVITGGGTRISEVAARFTLDAMPGRQMAIDADLNSGVIADSEARQRRDELSRQADFYGAMDGASKFVRGDAIACVVITLVNIAGGLYIGLVDHGWRLADSAALFTRLTIGDGLVSQVPAFVVAIAAGLLVTRSSARSDLSQQMAGQLFSRPKVLLVATAFLALMLFTGMPKLPLLLLGLCCAGLAYSMRRDEAEADSGESEELPAAPSQEVEHLLRNEMIEMVVGYGLVRLVDPAKGGDLLDRINRLRREIAIELGIVVPPIRIADNADLDANSYAVKVRGHIAARGVAYPEQLLAVDQAAAGAITGAIPTMEPVLNRTAFWITDTQRAEAEQLNYTILEAPDALAAHLAELVRAHAHELLSRQDMKDLLDNLRQRNAALVDEVIPSQIKPVELHRVCQKLLGERVPIRDLETILESLADCSARTKDPDLLADHARRALARSICAQHVDQHDRLWCVAVDPGLEDLISAHVNDVTDDKPATLPPQTAQEIIGQIAQETEELLRAGRPAVVVCSPQVRRPLRRIVERELPHVAVLGLNELVPGISVEAIAIVGLMSKGRMEVAA